MGSLWMEQIGGAQNKNLAAQANCCQYLQHRTEVLMCPLICENGVRVWQGSFSLTAEFSAVAPRQAVYCGSTGLHAA